MESHIPEQITGLARKVFQRLPEHIKDRFWDHDIIQPPSPEERIRRVRKRANSLAYRQYSKESTLLSQLADELDTLP